MFRSQLLTVTEHAACGCRVGFHEGGCTGRKVTLVRRGVYSCEGGGEELIVDGLTAAVYDGYSDFTVEHPTGEPPETTHIDPGEAVMDEAFPTDRYHTLVTPRAALKHHRLHALAGDPRADPLAVEEAVLDLLADLSESMVQRPVCGPAGLRLRRRLDAVRELIAAEPEVNHQLADLAREAGCSPFHFARLFKRETGSSVRAYRLRLRMALVLDRLRQGADDLADVALEAGFSHHSHMTSACRSLLGRTPSGLREELGRLRKAA